MSKQRSRQTRRLIGGYVWESDIEKIKKSIEAANIAATKMLELLQKNKNIPFVAAFSLYLVTITTSLTNVLSALDSIEETAKDYKQMNPEQYREVWREAIEEALEDEE